MITELQHQILAAFHTYRWWLTPRGEAELERADLGAAA
jgi:hypothetical protein